MGYFDDELDDDFTQEDEYIDELEEEEEVEEEEEMRELEVDEHGHVRNRDRDTFGSEDEE